MRYEFIKLDVSSNKRFNTFEFMGTKYKFIKSSFDDGVIEVKNIEGIKMTDRERTFIDSVNLVSKIGGIEELINITKMIEKLDQEKVIRYLEIYNKKVLYQKVGYFLENYYNGVVIGDDFFGLCKFKAGKSVRYLVEGTEGSFNDRWNLVIPEEYVNKVNGEGEPDDYI